LKYLTKIKGLDIDDFEKRLKDIKGGFSDDSDEQFV
jgi:hypothetical protein